MELAKQIIVAGLVLWLATSRGWTGTNDFECQTITLPHQEMDSSFADLGDGNRHDLLAVDAINQELLIYRQRASGFSNAPDQVIQLPPQTAWISPCHVETQTDIDLLMSTATGLVYFRQHDGVFESKPETLVRTDQVFTLDDSPILVSRITNASIPVVESTRVLTWQRDSAFHWSGGIPADFQEKQNTWFSYRNQ